jgi:hypothetical protein
MIGSRRGRLSAAVLSGVLLVSTILGVQVASAAPVVPGTPPMVAQTDMVVAGVGGLFETGSGTLTVGGVGAGTVTSAWLYWSGSTGSADPAANATITFAGEQVTGLNIGTELPDCDDFSTYINSQAYRADVTALVDGDGTYAIAGTTKSDPVTRASGASLIVFFDDGISANDKDVYIYEGNDADFTASFTADDWNVPLSGIAYAGETTATLSLHVENGQDFRDGYIRIDGSAVASGQVFDGVSVPNEATSSNLSRWDIRTFDITSRLTQGSNTLVLSDDSGGDCLNLIVATVAVGDFGLTPALSATLTTGDNPYTPGTWTNQPVDVAFACVAELGPGVGVSPLVTTTVSAEGADQQVDGPPCQDCYGTAATPLTVTDIDIDLTIPTIQPIPNQTLNATDPAGATFAFSPVLADNFTTTGDLASNCVDQNSQLVVSGQFIPVGTTTVTCTVADLAGNTASTSFSVTVLGSEDLFASLRANTIDLVSNTSAERSLLATIDAAQQAYERGNSLGAYFTMLRFVVQLDTYQSKRMVSPTVARQLIEEARQVVNSMI